MRVPLVRWGEDFKHPQRGHTAHRVYVEMFLQVCREYASLPDPQNLKAHQIRFFYEGLREELKRATKPKGQE